MALIEKLTAIADAIRGKTGGTEGMTLDSMVSAIESIEVGGGDSGAAYVTGSFTPTSVIYTAKITHNLNSTKVFLIWCVRDNPFYAKFFYRGIWGYAISGGVFPTRIVDSSAYNSNADGAEITVGQDTQTLNTNNALISPFNASATLSQMCRYMANTDPNSFEFSGREGFEVGVTYDWVVVDVSSIIPWAEEG